MGFLHLLSLSLMPALLHSSFRDASLYFYLNHSPGTRTTTYSGGKRGVGEGYLVNICHSIACQIILADLSDWAGVPSLPQCSMCIPLEASHSVEEDIQPR